MSLDTSPLARLRRTPLRLALVAASALPLAACISFGAPPPDSLLSLTAASTLPADTARVARDGQAVIVAIPSVPQELATPRVPVHASPTSIAYLKDAQWVDAPARLFRELLGETIAGRSNRVVLDPRQASLATGMRLGGRLAEFGLDAPSSSVVAIYDATLVRGDKAPVETRRFEARVPVTSQTVGTVAPALNQAANQIAVQVSDWVH
jgi:cholesterol transport system auxiliary component